MHKSNWGASLKNGSIEIQLQYSTTISHYETAAMPAVPPVIWDLDSREKK